MISGIIYFDCTNIKIELVPIVYLLFTKKIELKKL